MAGSGIGKGRALTGTKTEAALWPGLIILKIQSSIPSSRFYERFRERGQAEKRRIAISVTPSCTHGYRKVAKYLRTGARCTEQFKWTHNGLHVEVPLAPATFRVYRRPTGSNVVIGSAGITSGLLVIRQQCQLCAHVHSRVSYSAFYHFRAVHRSGHSTQWSAASRVTELPQLQSPTLRTKLAACFQTS
jgi:hypothetical protein